MEERHDRERACALCLREDNVPIGYLHADLWARRTTWATACSGNTGTGA